MKMAIKWKFEQDARRVQESQRTGPSNTRRVIRARLAIRGFNDVDARTLANHVGTSLRYSQRVLVLVVVQKLFG